MANPAQENARTAAVDTLTRWALQPAPIDRLFDSRAGRLAPADRRLARAIVYGVLRHQEVLDAALTEFSTHPLAKMTPQLRMTLRVGLFQLAFLSRIPASAAVNSTVNTAKRGRHPPWLVGFVNGVLRRAAAEREQLGRFFVDENGRPRCNHPEWLCTRWQAQFGEAAMRSICALNNQEPPLSLRVNTCKIGRADFLALLKKSGIRASPGRYSPVALVVEGYPGPLQTLSGYEAGFFQVQDEGAQLIAPLLSGFSTPVRVLDACAGLGGKTGHLAELLPAGSRIVALEPDRFRFRTLLENLSRLGHATGPGRRVEPLAGRLEGFARAQGRDQGEKFDAILVDAPCSGTGVIRRQPDIRWIRRPVDLPRYASGQIELLRQAVPLLRPGGLLVYATCSLEPEENMQVISRFLAEHSAFTPEPASLRLPERARKLVRAGGAFASRPTDGCDGFFACCLRRAL